MRTNEDTNPDEDGGAESQFREDWDADTWSEGEDVPWTLLPVEGLVDAYRSVVVPELRADGESADSRPTHAWLSSHGFRGLTYALSNYHDTTFGEFYAQHLDSGESDDGYDWPVDDEETIDLCEQYLEVRADRRSWKPRTVESKRYRLGRYARAHWEATGEESLVAAVKPDADTMAHEAIGDASDAARRLDGEIGRSRLSRIIGEVDAFYDFLVGRRLAGLNPIKPIRADYTADSRAEDDGSDASNPSLDADTVRSLAGVADSTRDELVVMALCGWGLRTNEVARLRVSQFVLEGDDPTIAFDERKNGPSRVSLLFGREILEARIEELATRDDWDGWLFPSSRSESGHVARGTINDWFDSLVDEADVSVGGRKPLPKMGRRFWYDAYSDVLEEIIGEVGEIAAEQGSSGAGVVLDDYLSPERKRTMRRDGMRRRLEAAFENK